MIELQPGGEDVDASLESGQVGDDSGQLLRISKSRANLELDFTDDSLWINRLPATPVVEQDVVVMQVAVQQSRMRLRCAQFGVDPRALKYETARNPRVAGGGVAGEGFSP